MRAPSRASREGAYVAAKWRTGRCSLAVIAAGGEVHIFDLTFSTGASEVIPGRVTSSYMQVVVYRYTRFKCLRRVYKHVRTLPIVGTGTMRVYTSIFP